VSGGSEVEDIRAYPWLAAMRQHEVKAFCTSTIVGSRWILTAGHCVRWVRPEEIKFTIGSTELGSKEGGESLYPARFIIHPEYRYSDWIPHHDVALVELTSPIKFSNSSRPVCLAADEDLVGGGEEAIAVGWGNIDYDFHPYHHPAQGQGRSRGLH